MTGRGSATVRMARAIQRLPLGWMHHLERPLLDVACKKSRPVFLIALPRSGSTLAYQALVHATDSAYLSNLRNFLYFLPLTGGLLNERRCRYHVSDFRSRQGFVEGACGPAEGLRFWTYWTGHGLSDGDNLRLARDKARQARVRHLDAVLAKLERRDRPFISGYIGHCLVVSELRAMFPNALFIRLKRDPVDNALSILRIQLEEGRDSFSVMPGSLGLPANAGIHDRVAAQVDILNRRVDQELDAARTVRVSYEDLCSDPGAQLQRVVRFCGDHGVALPIRAGLPERFARPAPIGEWEEHRMRLQEAFARRGAGETA